MNKIYSLIRAAMSEGMQMIPYRAKGESSGRIVPIALGALISTMLFMSVYATALSLKESGTEYTVLSLYVLITTVLTIMEGVYKSGDLLFNCRDNDMLLALPIKKSRIVFVRILKFYIFEMLYNLIFMVPAILAYALNVKVDASYYLVSVVMLVFLPAIPIAISCVVGAVSAAISARFRQKSALQVVISLLSIVMLFAILFAVNALSGVNETTVSAIGGKAAELYYPAGAFVRLATNFNFLELVQFVFINLAVVAFVVFVVARFYFQIVTRVNVVGRKEGAMRTGYGFKKRSQTGAMVHKEMVKYFSTPVLLTNTAFGLVLFVVAVGAACLKFDDIVGMLLESEDFPLTAEEIRGYASGIAFAMVSFTSLMTFITTTMVSLEGKAFNMLKSLPISGLKVVSTKILAAMLLIVPVTALGSLVMFVRFGFGIVDLALVLVGVIVVPLVTEAIGMLIDLKYANFNAESETEVVKQSPGVMVSSFLGLGMVIVTISLEFGVVMLAGQTAGLAIMDGIFLGISGILWLVLSSRSEEKYLKLSA